jgi:peptidoglycan-associated lipoprotein
MKQQMKMWTGLVLALGLVLVLSACGTRGKAPLDTTVEDRGTPAGETTGTGTESLGVQDYGQLGMEALQDPASPLYQRVVYFEFDSSTLSEADQELLAAHAAFLAGHPDLTVVLEGHTDERGSREYNIGLGESRGQSVRRQLEFQGVRPEQLRVVSYGEERPAMDGQDESAWRQNRRVELVYGGQ